MNRDRFTQRTPLGDMLVNRGLISPQQLKAALLEQSMSNKRLGEILVTRKLITLDQLMALLDRQHAIEEEFDRLDCPDNARVEDPFTFSSPF
jgi:hypothetical protein